MNLTAHGRHQTQETAVKNHPHFQRLLVRFEYGILGFLHSYPGIHRISSLLCMTLKCEVLGYKHIYKEQL